MNIVILLNSVHVIKYFSNGNFTSIRGYYFMVFNWLNSLLIIWTIYWIKEYTYLTVTFDVKYKDFIHN